MATNSTDIGLFFEFGMTFGFEDFCVPRPFNRAEGLLYSHSVYPNAKKTYIHALSEKAQAFLCNIPKVQSFSLTDTINAFLYRPLLNYAQTDLGTPLMFVAVHWRHQGAYEVANELLNCEDLNVSNYDKFKNSALNLFISSIPYVTAEKPELLKELYEVIERIMRREPMLIASIYRDLNDSSTTIENYIEKRGTEELKAILQRIKSDPTIFYQGSIKEDEESAKLKAAGEADKLDSCFRGNDDLSHAVSAKIMGT